MSAPLIPNTFVKRADTPLSRSELEHLERVAKAKAVNGAIAAINRGPEAPDPPSVTRASNGIGQILLVPDSAPQPCGEAKKAACVDLHSRVKPIAQTLSADGAQLLSLVVKADEAYRGAQLIDLSSFSMKSALGVSEHEAMAARSELERRGLIVFHDNGSGHRGFYPRVP
ncbi:hypothetical protein ACFHWW_08340 [Ensifer sp. P24N7]|uniref:hypothetical protein n=1 Tax=Sinorhizobium sp. P24N7 TaxID=3348358 RepID=UPI0035F39EF0